MKCQLRPWRMSDASQLAKVLSNKRALRMLRDGINYPYTEEDARKYIADALSENEDEMLALAVTVDDIAVGSIAATRQRNIHRRTAEIGYCLAEEYWGRGIMTDAVKQLCDMVFERTDIVRIYATPFADNVGSCRVLEKAGFECEGTLRKDAIKNNEILDLRMYALVR